MLEFGRQEGQTVPTSQNYS